MSYPQELACPSCGHQQHMEVWSSVNTGDKDLVHALKEQRLNIFECEKCKSRAFVDGSLLYHDLERGYCIQYLGEEVMGAKETYARITKQGTQVMDAISTAIAMNTQGEHFLRPHFVFGMDELVAYIDFRDRCARWGKDAPEETPAADADE